MGCYDICNWCHVPGVTEEGAAEATVNFAVRFDLLRKDEASRLRLVEVDYSDFDDIEASIPECVCAGPTPAPAPTQHVAFDAIGRECLHSQGPVHSTKCPIRVGAQEPAVLQRIESGRHRRRRHGAWQRQRSRARRGGGTGGTGRQHRAGLAIRGRRRPRRALLGIQRRCRRVHIRRCSLQQIGATGTAAAALQFSPPSAHVLAMYSSRPGTRCRCSRALVPCQVRPQASLTTVSTH